MDENEKSWLITSIGKDICYVCMNINKYGTKPQKLFIKV